MTPSSTPRTRAVRLTAAAAIAVGLAGVVALPASAHVRVKPDSTASGGYAGLTFRVPNESDNASTTKLVLTLPQNKPFSHVSVKPVPGWTAAVSEAPLPTPVTVKGTTLTKAARTITWTADQNAGIAPGQYQEFSISAGPLPAPGTVVLPVSQTYSDGKVVKWDQPGASGTEEPEHPAPQFDVTPATSSAHGSTSQSTVQADAEPVQDGPDLTARWLAGGALALAVVAVGMQVRGSRLRTRAA